MLKNHIKTLHEENKVNMCLKEGIWRIVSSE